MERWSERQQGGLRVRRCSSRDGWRRLVPQRLRQPRGSELRRSAAGAAVEQRQQVRLRLVPRKRRELQVHLREGWEA